MLKLTPPYPPRTQTLPTPTPLGQSREWTVNGGCFVRQFPAAVRAKFGRKAGVVSVLSPCCPLFGCGKLPRLY